MIFGDEFSSFVPTTQQSTAKMQLTIPQFPEYKVNLHKFSNVQNSKDIKEQLIQGNTLYDFAFINAECVISLEQLMSAVYRSLLDLTGDKLRTRSLHSEVIFSLSPTQNIMDALRRFGIQDNSKELILVKITKGGEDYSLQIIDGEEVQVTDESLQQTAVLKTIKKNYKISTETPHDITRQTVAAIQLRGL